MILGLLDEKDSDVWKTIWFLVKCSWVGVNDIGLGLSQPYPGCEQFNELLGKGAIDLSTDDFFIEQVLVDSIGKTTFHNKKIPSYRYHFYELLLIVIFYASNYLFRPIRFFTTIKNIMLRTYQSRAKRALGELIRKKLMHFFIRKKLFKQS
jgi:hypothetical protein